MKKIFFTISLSIIACITYAQLLPLTNWNYIQIDDSHVKYGDYGTPEWLRYFGVDMMDITGDGMAEIVAGREVYINPGAKLESSWEKVMLPENVDGIFFMNVDDDEFGDIIAQSLPDIWWFEAKKKDATEWEGIIIGQIPATSHTNSQGFEKAQFITGGKEEFVIAGDGNIYLFQIPKKPQKGDWSKTLICANTSDEGIGYGDIDGDGDLDIAAGRRPEGGHEPLILTWFENPGSVKEHWKDTEIAKGDHPIDRVEIADLNGDKKADIVYTEERYPGLEPDAHLFWFMQPANPKTDKWEKNRIVTQYSMNNLDIKDVDKDGDIDLITNEHKGQRLETQIWENDGLGVFTKQVVDQGKESHLGTQAFDMDGDGDLDIASIGWDNHEYVHLWRNDAITPDHVKWTRYSSENGDMEVPNAGDQQTSSLVADLDNDGINDFVITERTQAPAVTWYKKGEQGWNRHVVDPSPLRIEAGSAFADIDGDGDSDIVFAGEGQSNEVWWWENPFPNLSDEIGWKRYTIKKSGATKHHDQLFGDFDGDGRLELAFWNQNARTLFLAEIPEKPKEVDDWEFKAIYSYGEDSEMYPRGYEGYPRWKRKHEHEGLSKGDVDGDGTEDIVGGGRWFKYRGNGVFEENIVDASYVFTRSQIGDFIEGGRPEILLVVGDGVAPLYMYTWNEGTWVPKQITGLIDNGHTIDVLDFNHDGHLDIFSAEMRFGENNPNSKIRILLGDGLGGFTDYWVATGYGVHEGKIADLDGDGDFDILAKPYTWKAPRIDVWINEGK